MLAIITVIYNNYEILEDFFTSLIAQTSPNFSVFIADASQNQQIINTSTLTNIGVSVDITIIPNRGYAHGVNTCLTRAYEMNYQHFCIVNPDISFDRECVQKTKAALETHHEVILAGKIYYYPGFEYHKDTYSPDQLGHVIWYAGGRIDWSHALASHVGVDEVDRGQYQTEVETDFASGCFTAYDRAVADKVGEWDESYFMYYEDVDFCVRAKKKKIKTVYVPDMVIWHKNAQSTDGSGSQFHIKAMASSRLRFALRHAPLKTKLHVIKNKLIGRMW
jgi:GT2 family glycosyltransferase